MPSLHLNDPVQVHRDSSNTPVKSGSKAILEGVVAFLGPVDFNTDNDWVGVRLTGSSVGLGKNDGIVKGKRYFDCPSGCGIFVKTSAISKRQLSRLEELRLRRELAITGDGNSIGSGLSKSSDAVTPARSRKSSGIPRTPKLKSTRSDLSAAASDLRSSGISSATSSKLEEIRYRRAQLQSEGIEPSDTNDTEFEHKVQELESRVTSLQTDLSHAQEENKKHKFQIETLEKELKSTLAKLATSKKHTLADDAEAVAEAEIAQLQTQIEDLERKLDESLKSSKKAFDEIQTKFQQSEVHLAAAKAQATGLEDELANRDREAEDQAQSRSSEANHYKERAKLQADVASLTRRVEQLELDKQELEHNVEDLALDKDQLAEEKEALEDRLEEVKLDSETSQMELEETKMELEEVRTRLEVSNANVAKVVTTVGIKSSTSGELFGDDQQAQVDLAHNLSTQNARMREALIRLREQSSIEKMEMTRKLRTAEKHVEEATHLATQVESLRENNKELEEQILDLKDMVEQGSAYEIMVEDLSDRVLSLEEELSSSLQIVREMEEAAEITAEMEEVQSEELKALNRDMEDREAIIRNLEEAIKM